MTAACLKCGVPIRCQHVVSNWCLVQCWLPCQLPYVTLWIIVWADSILIDACGGAALLLVLLVVWRLQDADGDAAPGHRRPAPELEDTGVVGERAMGKGRCCI